jgi:hypothetical protein
VGDEREREREEKEKVKRGKEGKGTGQDQGWFCGPRVEREGPAATATAGREGERRWGMMIVGQAAFTGYWMTE